MTRKGAPDPRSIRQRHEEAIAALVRQREALVAEVAALERKAGEIGRDVARRTVELLALLDLLEEAHDDAEWVRRKAAIRARVRDLAAGRLAPPPERLVRAGVPPEVARQVHELVNRIQRDNRYAHVSGDYSDKTWLQNRLLATCGDAVDVRWDGDQLILIEFEGRSAGHFPLGLLTPEARRAVAGRLGLAPG